jgi:uncharacterized protein (DUF1697 family)
VPAYIALLRGINVGGHRKVPMPALREALHAASAADVATYVQSGNVVLDVEGDASDAAALVEGVLAARFDLDDVPVLVRTREELDALVAADPFPDADPTLHHVLFLAEPVAPARLDGLPAGRPTDVLVRGKRELHLHTPEGFRDSPLARALTDARLGAVVTARNWRTVTALAAMAAG